MTSLRTEQRVPQDKWIDQLPTAEALAVMLDNQAEAIESVRAALPAIGRAADALYERLSSTPTGRLIYAGAGTSARIAVQDGAELYPTFNWPVDRVAFIIAGGPKALLHPVENAEDSSRDAEKAVSSLNLGRDDCIIALTASGQTPFTLEIIRRAKRGGSLTIGIANNDKTDILSEADLPVLLDSGAEIVAGSTRLKAGTAQKICLNLLSTQLMNLFSTIENGLMADMIPRNEKLRCRYAEINAMLASDKA